MFYTYVNAPAQEQPEPTRPHPVRRRQPRYRGPKYPPARVHAALNYIGMVNDVVLRPFAKESGSSGVCGEGEHTTELVECDLHPLQYQSFKAACDCLTDYFNDRPDFYQDEAEIHPELIQSEDE